LKRCAGRVEGEVDVDLLVVRAVERPIAAWPTPHAERVAPREEHQLGIAGIALRLLEDRGPHVLGAAEHLGHEYLHFVGRATFLRGACLSRGAICCAVSSTTDGSMPMNAAMMASTTPPIPRPPTPIPIPRRSSTLPLALWSPSCMAQSPSETDLSGPFKLHE
jgi:hypothetical protein